MQKAQSAAVAVAVVVLVVLSAGCRSEPAAPGRSSTGAAQAPAPGPGQTPQTTPGQPSPEDRLGQFWARALHEVYRSPGELQAQHEREQRKGLQYAKLMRGDPAQRAVTLTFDDGPHPDFTPKLLAVLKQQNVKATFFVVGEMAEKHPDLIKAEQADGHLLGNHTYHHVNLTRIPEAEVRTEWQQCQDVVQSILGVAMKYCRPPGGDYDEAVIQAAMAVGLTTVLWTDDPGDYASPGDKVIEERVLGTVENGAIILLHDGVQQTIDVLLQVIRSLRKRGFTFETVDQMMQDRAAKTAPAGAGAAALPPGVGR